MRGEWLIGVAMRGAVLVAMLLLADPAEAGSVGRCGGSGVGNNVKTLSCPSGKYIVGIFARGDPLGYVDRIGIRCAGFNAQGVRGTLGAFQYAGGTGGTKSSSGNCSGDRAVARIFSKTGTYFDRIRTAICATRQPQGGFFRVVNPISKFTLDIGGIGGGDCGLVCPEFEAMHKLIVRYGSWIDSIEAFCKP